MADLLPVHSVSDGSTVIAYFRTSDVYGETAGIGAKVNIKKVPVANLSGDEIIVPVKELLRTADLIRIGVRYKDASNRRKSARILCGGASISAVFGPTAANNLTGVAYKIGAGASRGNIVSVGLIRRATTY